ncbi:hypothetical protein C8R44DRAFT_592693, partial [Mycena epipterygia]
MGIHPSLLKTYNPPNHPSALSHPDVVQKYIRKELSECHYTGPFSKLQLALLIAPFRSSPL